MYAIYSPRLIVSSKGFVIVSAHQRGRSLQTSSCCCVVGYAKDKHPEAARNKEGAQSMQSREGRGVRRPAQLHSSSPFTVSREHDMPSVRTRYKSAFFGQARGLHRILR